MRNSKKIATRVFAIALAAATVTTAASASRVHLTYANTSVSYADAEMKVMESGAWLESAYVTWNPVSEADGYNVYYKAAAEDDSVTEEITYLHNFTSAGKTSDFFTITGSLSSSKGTVTYNGFTLTQCLKMESSTSITFKTDSEAELVLVSNPSCNKAIEIDGTVYSFKNGVLTVTLEAGSHTIKKADSNVNVYYISLIQK